MKKLYLPLLALTAFASLIGCQGKENKEALKEDPALAKAETPFFWEGANLYFLLTDRFNNGDPSNDLNFGREKETATLRGFMGGDLKGITQKIEEGYFNELGVNAIWFTPVVEQIHDGTDEGTGYTYGFHGYWTKDWTALDPNFGSMEDLAALVETAHAHGIRIVMDAVINHTGPVTEQDPVWPEAWVRTEPKCTYDSYKNAIECTLVENLPDIRTESDAEVELPEALVAKWKKEGRYEKEMQELDAFFERTGYPRAPKYFIIKWLTDFVRDFGIDGFRSDTVRHIEEAVWLAFKTECEVAFDQWKKAHPSKVMDENNFYMVGEVYDYEIIKSGKYFDFGDKKVNYYAHGFNSMINFEFKKSATEDYESLFSSYSDSINAPGRDIQVLNYLTSHDDGYPFDKERQKTYETATKLMLAPGTAQIYYGDESARTLIVEGTQGDATLRSFMNWEALKNDTQTQDLHKHWQKLGQFRRDHPAIGAGVHQRLAGEDYVFMRSFSRGDFNDQVVVGLDLEKGEKRIEVAEAFPDGTEITDRYSGEKGIVKEGVLSINSPFEIVLLEK